ncbi:MULTISPECIES: DUF3322 and DUF2220 domain-containing protein [Janibacter]|uniref:Wadjet anti-phage system protein JetD domain-containing protein n=1 Tax=Janibacter TaxID=53457 RepID=UPI000832EE4F|nr:DUF3322 and DUF2220 domain-containing protein [Janibacter terrae]
MITLREARELAGQRLHRRLSAWATEAVDVPAMSIALRPPTEREVRSDELAAESWVREWDAARLPPGAELDWETRSWRSIGRQAVPVRLRLRDPDAVAALAKGEPARRWRTLSERLARIHDVVGDSEGVRAAARRHSATLVELTPERFDQIVAAADWLCHNDVDGMRPRQLPIRGVDSKWFGAHRGVLSALVLAASGRADLGIVAADPLVRVRVLDRELARGGVDDFAASRAQLRSLELDQRVTFVFENLESVLAMPPWPGAVVVHGSGYAVDVIAELPWVRRAPVVYWGDLDSHGFAILHRLRTHLPEVVSVLMDVETLLAHRDLWVPDPQPVTARLPSLTDVEQVARARLAEEGHVRLEQERIPWATAITKLGRATQV